MSKNQDEEFKNKQSNVLGRTILWRGIRALCPQCGKGSIYQSYLKQVSHCTYCQEDIGSLQADDGTAWLTILVVGHILAPFFAFFALNETLPQWLLIGILVISIIGLVFLLLPRCKGFFIAALWLIKRKKG